ncbi:MAG: T9SS C-terminal target domain-containing protein, partial [Bacteroidetes bacterium]
KIALKNTLNGDVQVALYNVLGAQVYAESLNNGITNGHEIRTNDLGKGIYLLQITHQGKVITQKVTIH